MRFRLPHAIIDESFSHFRRCGAGRRECQVLWIGPWADGDTITEVVHPQHHAHHCGFELDGAWLNDLWIKLADRNVGIRVQVHTHPQGAFHSPTDDAWPIVHTPGFLSLVIPDFGLGRVGLDGAFLAEFDKYGRFHEVEIDSHLVIK
jgi:hypothetical protein